MDPSDERITAAKLLALRPQPDALAAISELLGVSTMRSPEAHQTKQEIAHFVSTGDATYAAQLIHAAGVRRNR